VIGIQHSRDESPSVLCDDTPIISICGTYTIFHPGSSSWCKHKNLIALSFSHTHTQILSHLRWQCQFHFAHSSPLPPPCSARLLLAPIGGAGGSLSLLYPQGWMGCVCVCVCMGRRRVAVGEERERSWHFAPVHCTHVNAS